MRMYETRRKRVADLTPKASLPFHALTSAKGPDSALCFGRVNAESLH